jgi:homoserine O-acetyltransferase/O-succinyltransferase
MEREMARIKDARLVMVPASAATHGHFTHLRAAVWKNYLAEFMSMAP